MVFSYYLEGKCSHFCCSAYLASAPNLAAMADCDHHDRQDVLVDRVDDAVVADSDPVGVAAGELGGCWG